MVENDTGQKAKVDEKDQKTRCQKWCDKKDGENIE